jgi:hypothetical protein
MGKVVHCKKEGYTVYIGRPGKWGNPFSHRNDTQAKHVVETREEAIEKYILYGTEMMVTGKWDVDEVIALEDEILGCWCKPQACHGDAILDVLVPRAKYLRMMRVRGEETDAISSTSSYRGPSTSKRCEKLKKEFE